MIDIRKQICQGGKFTFISGIGWLIDFSLYTYLSVLCGVSVQHANMLSSLPAITLVFIFAVRHIFVSGENGMNPWGKYFFYLLYQALLVGGVSIFAGFLEASGMIVGK